MAFYIARTDHLTSDSGIYLLKGEVIEDVPGKVFTYPDKFGYKTLIPPTSSNPKPEIDTRRSYSSESDANAAIASLSETDLKVVEE